MRALDIDRGLVLFQFEPEPGGFEGLNALAVIEGREVILVDAGYEANAEEIAAWLAERSLEVRTVIATHFHPDHVLGSRRFPEATLVGSAAYRITTEAWFEVAALDSLTPDIAIADRLTLRLGSRVLEIESQSGHTEDSLAVLIDGTWMHVGDTLLLSNDGRPILPSVQAKPIGKHLAALRGLLARSGLRFIPGHGGILAERAERERDLRDRIAYLEAVESAKGDISLAEASRGLSRPFLGEAWHEENCRSARS